MYSRDLERQILVMETIHARGITDPNILNVMNSIPRHEFIPEEFRRFAYEDLPVKIGFQQTISQPYMVAYMASEANIQPTDKILEIGTGSGYNAAVLGALASNGMVYSTEIIPELHEFGKDNLHRLGLDRNIKCSLANGSVGLPKLAPFDVIMITAAAPALTNRVKEQLAIGGRLLVPVHNPERKCENLIKVVRRSENEYEEFDLGDVTFVPLRGEDGFKN